MSDESTTRDLVEVVTGLFEAADRGDWEAVISPYASDVIWETGDGIVNLAGASRVRSFWEEAAGMFEGWTIKVESVVDLGRGVVYTICDMQGRPAGSTGVVATRGALVFEWTEGTIVRVIAYTDINEGRAAAERLAESRR
jgi:ketosteroid isomerase-like protein